MKIAIDFGDNDFYNTFYGVLEMLQCAIKWNKKLETASKKELAKIINNLSYGAYLTYQDAINYHEEDAMEEEFSKKYLGISEYVIMLGNEVDEYLATDPDDNSSMFILYEDKIITR